MTQQSESVTAVALLLCPFCGKPPFERFEKNINGPQYPDQWFVWCENLDCGAGGEAMEETQEAARAAWNTRAPSQPAASGGVAELKAEIERLTDEGTELLIQVYEKRIAALSSTDGGAK